MKFIIKPVCQIVKFRSKVNFLIPINFTEMSKILLTQSKTLQGVAVVKHGELLTKTGRHNLTFSGKSLALPTSENISIVFKSSLAHNLHSPILGEIPKNFGKTTNP